MLSKCEIYPNCCRGGARRRQPLQAIDNRRSAGGGGGGGGCGHRASRQWACRPHQPRDCSCGCGPGVPEDGGPIACPGGAGQEGRPPGAQLGGPGGPDPPNPQVSTELGLQPIVCTQTTLILTLGGERLLPYCRQARQAPTGPPGAPSAWRSGRQGRPPQPTSGPGVPRRCNLYP